MQPTSETHADPSGQKREDADSLYIRDIFWRLRHGFSQIVGFGLIGLALACAGYFLMSPVLPISTTTRVNFAFKGFEKGEYPDGSKFNPDDLRAPDVIAAAVREQGLMVDQDFITKIRGALTVEGIVPPEVAKERDRLRSGGQIVPPYYADEFEVSLTLPQHFSLSSKQRESFLLEVVSLFREKFQRTYVDTPLAFGDAFATLQNADYFEYELILNQEMSNINGYLAQQEADAKTFRSATTNLSFDDLIKQTQIFSQIQLNETLGLILLNGLSRDRATAMVKMDYYLRVLDDQARKASAEQSIVQDLLSQAQSRTQGYVLGIKSQANAPRTESPIVDQGLVDSLLANDSYNFLVRQALEAGFKVKRVEAEKTELVERRKAMEAFMNNSTADQTVITAAVEKSLKSLGAAYRVLTDNIRRTQADYARQQFSDAVRISGAVKTRGMLSILATVAALGFMLGVFFGAGLSLVDIYWTKRRFP